MQKRVKCGIGDCPLFHIFLFLEFLQQRHQVADIGLREFRIADECVEKGGLGVILLATRPFRPA